MMDVDGGLMMEDQVKHAMSVFLTAFLVGIDGFGGTPRVANTILNERINGDGHELGYLCRLWRRGIITETQLVMAARDIEARWPHE